MLPRSRNTTYGDGTAVRPADLDDLQDAIVGGKHGVLTLWFAPVLTGADAGRVSNVELDNGLVKATANVAFFNNMPLGGIFEGTTIIGLKMRCKGTGAAGSIFFNLTRGLGDGTYDQNTLTVVNPPAAYATYSVTFGAPLVTLEGHTFTASCALNLNTMEIAALGLVIARD